MESTNKIDFKSEENTSQISSDLSESGNKSQRREEKKTSKARYIT
jgi:hypothetical protein